MLGEGEALVAVEPTRQAPRTLMSTAQSFRSSPCHGLKGVSSCRRLELGSTATLSLARSSRDSGGPW